MKRSRLTVKHGIDLAPMVDIIFLLLAYFLINSTLAQRAAMDIELPKSEEAAASQEKSALDIVVTADGVWKLNERELDRTALAAELKESLAANPERPVRLFGDENAKYSDVIAALSEIRNAEAQNFQLMTRMR